jgi:hypothetical protein
MTATAANSCSIPSTDDTATRTKALVLVLADPKSGGEEALGRLFNALATAYDFKQNGDDVELLFHGTGTRWIAELERDDHPAHALFEAVRDTVGGVSCGCADVFGGREDAEESGFDLITDNAVPGTSGLSSLQRYVSDGYTVLTF